MTYVCISVISFDLRCESVTFYIWYSSQTSLHSRVGHTHVFFNLIQVDQSKHACDMRVRPLILHSSKSLCTLYSYAFCAGLESDFMRFALESEFVHFALESDK